ncbi:MAG: BspA family leucine-rich repeat surface protein [Lachnospiraceae bacterium]
MCGKENDIENIQNSGSKYICSSCGFDESKNYRRYSTLICLNQEELDRIQKSGGIDSVDRYLAEFDWIQFGNRLEDLLMKKETLHFEQKKLIDKELKRLRDELQAVYTTQRLILDCPNLRWQNESIKKARVLMQDSVVYYLSDDKSSYTILGSDIKRSFVKKIEFRDSFVGMAEDAWDVSEAKNGTVVAWLEKQTLVIAGAGGPVIGNTVCESLFAGYSNVEKIEFNECFDTSQVINMKCMFDGCGKLNTLDVTGLNTSQVTDMSWMFCGCANLIHLNVSSFDTNQVTNMSWMFCGCSSLINLDASNFDTSRVRDMSYMFKGCRKLTELEISGFSTKQVNDMSNMLNGCINLNSIGKRKFSYLFDTKDKNIMKGVELLVIKREGKNKVIDKKSFWDKIHF